MRNFLTKILGSPNDKVLKDIQEIVVEINEFEPELERLSDDELRAKTAELRKRIDEEEGDEELDDILPEAYAVVREAAKRSIGQRPFDVQLMGGIVLHQGKIAEMKTGEGKTQVATLPLYLNSLEGKGAHLITPNDYLSRIGGGWMGPLYHRLGITVGVITHESAAIFDPDYVDEEVSPDDRLNHWRPVSRQEAYQADITYGTNHEFGFDYLRDNLALVKEAQVQRPLHFAIVDEVDNILIDEARTPLIISGNAEETIDRYYQFARLVRQLRENVHYEIDLKQKSAILTDDGVDKMERLLQIPEGQSLYDDRYSEMTHYLEQALKAQALFHRDKDYIVRDGEVIIVDEFTGRMMLGRRYSEGLHQAIEAKENVRVQQETVTQATITFQNYFRMYNKLAGMTGTAETEAEEFATIYNLEVVVIPTNRPMVRDDFPDQVYRSEMAKFNAVAREIDDMTSEGRPVLVGTTSVEKSELLSDLLQRRGIKHEVLNAKFHEREAAIVAQAGQPRSVTIATNMAGRGTDITLGDGVKDKGGLHIIGTERHESRRIDNQLRGRAGRQGDPGSSRFFLSLEDELLRRFGSNRISGLMDKLGMDDETPIEHGLISKTIENAQTKVEGHNFDLRKHLVEYDDVMNRHREVIYAERRKLLDGENLKQHTLDLIEHQIEVLVEANMPIDRHETPDYDEILRAFGGVVGDPMMSVRDIQDRSSEEMVEIFSDRSEEIYNKREEEMGEEQLRTLERLVMLQVIDKLWVEHLTSMDHMRQGIGLQAYGQRDPLVEYKTEGFRMFQALLQNIEYDVAHMIFNVRLAPIMARPAPQIGQTNHPQEAGPVRRKAKGKVGRNDPCPCGSGKKFKNCHGASSAVQRTA